jgi:hypothetical protein
VFAGDLRTPTFPGNRIRSLANSQIAVTGIYDYGKSNQLLAIYDLGGRLVRAMIKVPENVLRLSPLIDESVLTVTKSGRIVVGTATLPTLWFVDDTRITEFQLRPPGNAWNQIRPAAKPARTLQEVREWIGNTSELTDIGAISDSTLIVGWHNGPYSEGSDYLAMISVSAQTGVLVKEVPGPLLGVWNSEVAFLVEEGAGTSVIESFDCSNAFRGTQ